MPGVFMLSRGIKRVPLDFDAPLNRTWSGYVMPDELVPDACPACAPHTSGRYGRDFGDGLTVEARAIADAFYAFGAPEALRWSDKLGQAEVDHLIKKGRLRECVDREPTEDNPRTWEWVSVPRTAAEVNAANRGRGLDLVHDAINRHYLVEFRCRRLGIEMRCPTCRGHGYVGEPERLRAYEEWDHTEPPTGDGIQMWESISEGSPISRVYPDTESGRLSMANELASTQGGITADMGAGDWLAVIKDQVHGKDIATGALV